MVEHAVWCCGQSAVLSFQSLWGELHHQREMIESLSTLHFHSFLLEWINLCPLAQDCVCLCMHMPVLACSYTSMNNIHLNSLLNFVVYPSNSTYIVSYEKPCLCVFIFQTLICIEDEWSRWKLVWPCQGRVTKTQRMFCWTSWTQVRICIFIF